MTNPFVVFGIPVLGSIILMVNLAQGLNFLWKKLGFKINFLFSFAISYFLISWLLLYLLVNILPSYRLNFDTIAGPMILSYPMGMIPDAILDPPFSSLYFVFIAGTIQWCLLAFFYQKSQEKKKSLWYGLFTCSSLSILAVILFNISLNLFGRWYHSLG
jgi:hypothetical protein